MSYRMMLITAFVAMLAVQVLNLLPIANWRYMFTIPLNIYGGWQIGTLISVLGRVPKH